LLHFSFEPIVTPGIAAEDLPKIRAAIGHARLKKAMGALRILKWQTLPTLLADCLGRPVVAGTMACSSTNILVATRGKKGSPALCYFLQKSGMTWTVTGEGALAPGNLFPIQPQPPPVNASAAK
jgi:hypothetical protein